MTKRVLLAATLLSGVATTASAEIVFVGTIKIVGQTAQCSDNQVNEVANSVFHPAAVGGNANFAGLSWVWSHYARAHELPGRNFDTTYRAVRTGGSGWGSTYTVPAASEAQIRIISSVPAASAITATTQYLTITGQIKSFDGNAGGLACIIAFQATYMKDGFQ